MLVFAVENPSVKPAVFFDDIQELTLTVIKFVIGYLKRCVHIDLVPEWPVVLNG